MSLQKDDRLRLEALRAREGKGFPACFCHLHSEDVLLTSCGGGSAATFLGGFGAVLVRPGSRLKSPPVLKYPMRSVRGVSLSLLARH